MPPQDSEAGADRCKSLSAPIATGNGFEIVIVGNAQLELRGHEIVVHFTDQTDRIGAWRFFLRLIWPMDSANAVEHWPQVFSTFTKPSVDHGPRTGVLDKLTGGKCQVDDPQDTPRTLHLSRI